MPAPLSQGPRIHCQRSTNWSVVGASKEHASWGIKNQGAPVAVPCSGIIAPRQGNSGARSPVAQR